MGKIVAVVGNTGAGKTTLVRALCRMGKFNFGLEQHAERPFQQMFKNDPRYALANQLDYMLQRAKQEQEFRSMEGIALVDGGLDLDFYGFTRLFHYRGWLSNEEFQLCEELYGFFRSYLPHPDLSVHLIVDHDLIEKRLAERDRINIARSADLEMMNSFIISWLEKFPSEKVVQIDASNDDPAYSNTTSLILDKIASLALK
jgi:deoxyadenosine/deoxycytidine kinase